MEKESVDELLLAAARDGNEVKVVCLLERQANPNYKDDQGFTPLHWAARNYYTKVVSSLIQHNANYNEKDELGRTPLDLAVQEGNEKVVDILIKCKDETGVTPLHCAARDGDARLIATLITKYRTDFCEQDKWGNLPLHYAVLKGQRDVVSVLASLKWCINAKNIEGHTPLDLAVRGEFKDVIDTLVKFKDELGATFIHLAAKEGDTRVVSTLLQYGADIEEKDELGRTPLDLAVQEGNEEVVDILINCKDETGVTPLHCAARDGDAILISTLITKYRTDLCEQDKWGNIPLHYAVLKGQRDVVSVLASFKRCINAKNIEGHTPLDLAVRGEFKDVIDTLVKLKYELGATLLHCAAEEGDTRVVSTLLQYGADIEEKDELGNTPLHCAALNGNKDVVIVLLTNKADTHARNVEGNIPLHCAVLSGKRDVVSFLVIHKEDLNVKNNEGRVPLYFAVQRGNIEVVECLIQCGAKIDEKDESGATPLHCAAREGETNIVSILLQYGANVNEKDKAGNTPFHGAALNKRTDVVSILINRGGDINAKNKEGETAVCYLARALNETHLHSAARLGVESAVVQCFPNEDSLNKHNSKGETPLDLLTRAFKETKLHSAARFGITSVVAKCLQNGDSVFAKNSKGETALFLLAKAYNETELHSAARFGIESAVLQCLQKENVVNYCNSQGKTPLHLAAVSGSVPIIIALLKNGALFGETDIYGKTAYDLAEEKNQEEVVRIFKKILTTGLPRELSYLSTSDESTFTSNLRAGFYLSYNGKVMTVGHEAVGKTAITAVLIGKTPSKVRKPTDCIDLHIYRAAVNMDTLEWETTELDLEDIAFRDLLTPPTAVLPDLDDIEKEDDKNDDEEENIVKEEGEIDTDTDEEAQKPRQPQDGGNADLKHKTESLKRRHIKSKIQWLKMKLGMEKPEIRTIEDIRRESIKRGKKGLLSSFLAAVNMMDFGGQVAFYSTHQTFLTYRGVYLLVIDGSRNFDDVIETEPFIPGSHEKPTGRVFTFFWVWSIISNSKGISDEFPKIVPVLTHRDKVLQNEADQKMNTIYGEIQKMFKGTLAITHLVLDERIFLNAMDPTDPGYSKLKEVLVKQLRDQPSWGEKLPKSWIYLKLCLQRAVEKGDFIMSMESMRRINNENPVNVLTEKELQLFLKMHHCQGELIHFPLPTLRDHIVISPKFLIDVLRSLITEKSFCKGARLEALESLNKNGILMKKDVGVIWKGKLKHNEEYFYSLFEHLDILAIPRKYNEFGSLMKSDKYYVPSLIRAVDNTDYLQDRFESRSISASFKFANNVMPTAVGYRLIASCIDMYEVLRYGDQLMLFSGMVVVKVKKNLDLVVILKSGRVNFSLVHSSSRFEIVRDTADGVLECLKDNLTNILESYRVTASEGQIKHDLQFLVEFPCGDVTSPCYGECTADWTCSHEHNVTKEVRNRWIVDRKTETCAADCEGVSDCDLAEKLTELHLAKLSMQFDYEDLRQLVLCLGLKSRDIERIEHDFPRNLQNIKFVCLRTWQKKYGATVGDLIQAIKDCELNVHAACQMRRDKPIPKLKLEMAEEPSDRVLDAISNEVIANSLLLSVELGLKAAFWIDLMHHRNISDINREVLEKWRKEKPGKGGIKELSQALCNVDVNLEALLSDL